MISWKRRENYLYMFILNVCFIIKWEYKVWELFIYIIKFLIGVVVVDRGIFVRFILFKYKVVVNIGYRIIVI